MAANTPNAADLQRLKKNIADVEQRISSASVQSNQLQQELKTVEVQLSALERSVIQITQQVAEQQKQLQLLQQQEKQLSQQQQQQQQRLIEQITLSYRMGREKNIKLLLNQEQPEKILRIRTYADYFSRAHLQALQQYQQTLTAIDQNKNAIQQQSEQLLANKTQLSESKQQVQQRYQQRSITLANLNKDIKTDKQQLAKWQQEQKQLEALLRQVNEAITSIRLPNDATPFVKNKGQLPWPTQGKLIARYGQARGTGDLRWEGIAIAATKGQKVQAVHHGRVVYANWFRGKGLLLIIDHGDGYMSLYAHNQTLLKETGDWVSAGETIATVGDSGGVENTALYFEIRWQGKPLNPSQWLKRG